MMIFDDTRIIIQLIALQLLIGGYIIINNFDSRALLASDAEIYFLEHRYTAFALCFILPFRE
jgi:hypothetical protein